MYAIAEILGKQYKVEPGCVVFSEKIDILEGQNLSFSVVALYNEAGFKFGKPYLDVSVNARVLKHGKSKKITVFTYKPKKSCKRKMGHRQQYTKLEIISIA
ncbi:MAG: 50S ribosomal protein L21 [Oscillospiraceae bacterium]|jgi:large subunit ribosomal protein L21|nr:50S ribosomal protein L21 [Oscillospiraceae bacterium]